jgi:acyl carrier protein
MNNHNILSELNQIFKEVLDNEGIVLSGQTTAKDIQEWYSLTNIEIIVAIEKRYHFHFNPIEIGDWRNVGDICNSIEKKIVR